MKLNQFDAIKHLRFKSQVSLSTLKLLKEQVYRTLRDQEKDEVFETFMEWQPKNREIMLYTDYCSNGFDLPATFDSMIQTNKPEIIINTIVVIPFAVLNGWAAITEISKGHRHVCLLQFANDIPEMIKNLPEVNDNKHQNEYDAILFNSGTDSSIA